MKIKTTLMLAAGAAVGYVFGTRAGRVRFEQLKARADTLVHDPKVRSTVSNLAEQVKQHADVAPAPVARLIRTAADQVKSSMDPVRETEPTTF